MRVILSELLTTEYMISTPFDGLLGRVPVRIYAVLDRTAILQIPGEDQRRVIRHDFITVDPDKLRARATPMVHQLHTARVRGRENSHKHNGQEPLATSEIKEFHQTKGGQYNTVEFLANIAAQESGEEG